MAERLPGAGFGSALPVGAADDPLLVTPAAAVRADGAAAVGWVDLMDGRVLAVVRPGPGGFGQPVQLARRVPLGIDRVLLDLFLGDSALEPEEDVQPVAVTFARGDRAVLAWAASAGRDGVFSIAPSVATVPLTGGAAQVEALGNGLRDVQGITPVVLADGAPAVAWIDEAARPLHLAVDGVDDATEDGPAPRVRIGAPRRRVVDADEAIELPVTCSAACDVRVSAGKGAWLTGTELSLQRAGTRALRIHPELAPIARLDGKPIPVHVRFGAPGTLRPQSRTVMVRVRRRPGAPLPRVRDVRVRRDGDDVVVTWRTQRATEKENFIAYAGVEPRGNALGAAEATGSGRRFRTTIRNVASARYVTVVAGSDDTGLTRRTTVEIKR